MVFKVLFIFCLCWSLQTHAQQTIFSQQTVDDTLPIANQRFDDAVEPPKDNFTSSDHNDIWDRFERGDVDEKEYAKWKGLATPKETSVAENKKSAKNASRGIASLKKSKQKIKKTKNKKNVRSKKLSANKKNKNHIKKAVQKKPTKKRLPASLPPKHLQKKMPQKHIQKKTTNVDDGFQPIE